MTGNALFAAATALQTASPATVLQAGLFGLRGAELVVQIGEFVGGALGLFIAYQAYRGYRRNDSEPMFYIALGFAIIFAFPFLFLGVYALVPDASLVSIQGAIQLVELVGMAAIIYALRM